ncbi:RICIN domain-containing protein, partial [Streptomyces phyllanthi]|uniref:RICIN domain-containing protein n=1 Tax=Streptomyces phyllanthi TaxID=1803180 RepID=UPI0018842FA0
MALAVLAVLVVSGCVLVPLALASASGTTPESNSPSGSASSGPGQSGGRQSGIGAGDFLSGPLEGRLRNAESGLCVGVDGTKVVAEVKAVLAICTSSVRQQWSYETGGLLRSLADIELCLYSRLGLPVRLGSCDAPALRGRVRYALTLDGALLPRGASGLALAPASAEEGADLLLEERTDDASQRWVIDSSVESLQTESVSRVTDASPRTPHP